MASKSNIQKKFEEIFSFKDDSDRLQFEAEIIHLDIMHNIQCMMDNHNINKTELARRLNTSKGYITQLFTADKLLNLKTLAKLQRIFQVKFDLNYKSLKSLEFKKTSFTTPEFKITQLPRLGVASRSQKEMTLKSKFRINGSVYGLYKLPDEKKQKPGEEIIQKVA